MEGREAKDRLYETFARTAKALSSPKRLELLDVLAQGERPVEALAEVTAMGVTNTSAHLQVLARSHLVVTRRAGTRIFYRLAGDDVAAFLVALRELSRAHGADVDHVVNAYFAARDDLEPVGREELARRVADREVIVLDVRPAEEYMAGHIPGARSVPLDELDAVLARLPKRTEVVAYCRGPYCVLAPQAVERLRFHGFKARRLAEGFPEWRLAGLPVAVGEQ